MDLYSLDIIVLAESFPEQFCALLLIKLFFSIDFAFTFTPKPYYLKYSYGYI